MGPLDPEGPEKAPWITWQNLSKVYGSQYIVYQCSFLDFDHYIIGIYIYRGKRTAFGAIPEVFWHFEVKGNHICNSFSNRKTTLQVWCVHACECV